MLSAVLMIIYAVLPFSDDFNAVRSFESKLSNDLVNPYKIPESFDIIITPTYPKDLLNESTVKLLERMDKVIRSHVVSYKFEDNIYHVSFKDLCELQFSTDSAANNACKTFSLPDFLVPGGREFISSHPQLFDPNLNLLLLVSPSDSDSSVFSIPHTLVDSMVHLRRLRNEEVSAANPISLTSAQADAFQFKYPLSNERFLSAAQAKAATRAWQSELQRIIQDPMLWLSPCGSPPLNHRVRLHFDDALQNNTITSGLSDPISDVKDIFSLLKVTYSCPPNSDNPQITTAVCEIPAITELPVTTENISFFKSKVKNSHWRSYKNDGSSSSLNERPVCTGGYSPSLHYWEVVDATWRETQSTWTLLTPGQLPFEVHASSDAIVDRNLSLNSLVHLKWWTILSLFLVSLIAFFFGGGIPIGSQKLIFSHSLIHLLNLISGYVSALAGLALFDSIRSNGDEIGFRFESGNTAVTETVPLIAAASALMWSITIGQQFALVHQIAHAHDSKLESRLSQIRSVSTSLPRVQFLIISRQWLCTILSFFAVPLSCMLLSGVTSPVLGVRICSFAAALAWVISALNFFTFCLGVLVIQMRYECEYLACLRSQILTSNPSSVTTSKNCSTSFFRTIFNALKDSVSLCGPKNVNDANEISTETKLLENLAWPSDLASLQVQLTQFSIPEIGFEIFPAPRFQCRPQTSHPADIPPPTIGEVDSDQIQRDFKQLGHSNAVSSASARLTEVEEVEAFVDHLPMTKVAKLISPHLSSITDLALINPEAYKMVPKQNNRNQADLTIVRNQNNTVDRFISDKFKKMHAIMHQQMPGLSTRRALLRFVSTRLFTFACRCVLIGALIGAFIHAAIFYPLRESYLSSSRHALAPIKFYQSYDKHFIRSAEDAFIIFDVSNRNLLDPALLTAYMNLLNDLMNNKLTHKNIQRVDDWLEKFFIEKEKCIRSETPSEVLDLTGNSVCSQTCSAHPASTPARLHCELRSYLASKNKFALDFVAFGTPTREGETLSRMTENEFTNANDLEMKSITLPAKIFVPKVEGEEQKLDSSSRKRIKKNIQQVVDNHAESFAPGQVWLYKSEAADTANSLKWWLPTLLASCIVTFLLIATLNGSILDHHSGHNVHSAIMTCAFLAGICASTACIPCLINFSSNAVLNHAFILPPFFIMTLFMAFTMVYLSAVSKSRGGMTPTHCIIASFVDLTPGMFAASLLVISCLLPSFICSLLPSKLPGGLPNWESSQYYRLYLPAFVTTAVLSLVCLLCYPGLLSLSKRDSHEGTEHSNAIESIQQNSNIQPQVQFQFDQNNDDCNQGIYVEGKKVPLTSLDSGSCMRNSEMVDIQTGTQSNNETKFKSSSFDLRDLASMKDKIVSLHDPSENGDQLDNQQYSIPSSSSPTSILPKNISLKIADPTVDREDNILKTEFTTQMSPINYSSKVSTSTNSGKSRNNNKKKRKH